jgi:hypothetical protein
MANRIKGQDVTISVVNNGVPVSFIKDVRNFELTPKFEKLEEQYLGQTSKQYDNIFHGVDFKMDLHLEQSTAFDFVKAIKEAAQSRGSATASSVNITASLLFPGGQAKDVVLNSCYFEDMPFSIGGRSEYVQFSLSGSCSDISGI